MTCERLAPSQVLPIKALQTRRQGHKLTPQRLQEVQSLLDGGESIQAISTQVGVLQTTLHKAIDCGRLRQVDQKKHKSMDKGILLHRAQAPRASEV
jgi:transposase-like protein